MRDQNVMRTRRSQLRIDLGTYMTTGIKGSTLPIAEDVYDDVERMTLDDEMTPQQISKELEISLGSVMRICSRRGISPVQLRRKEARALRNTKPLTLEQYRRVQEFKQAEHRSAEIADALELPLIEVNAAYSAFTYDRYLIER